MKHLKAIYDFFINKFWFAFVFKTFISIDRQFAHTEKSWSLDQCGLEILNRTMYGKRMLITKLVDYKSLNEPNW